MTDLNSLKYTAEHEWIAIDGDVATVGVPKAGVFAEGAARSIATTLVATIRDGDGDGFYDGLGSCYIEFGAGQVGRVDVDFLSGPKPTGTFQAPSDALAAQLQEHVKQQTSPYKYPRIVEFARDLPKTASGKIKRAQLRG